MSRNSRRGLSSTFPARSWTFIASGAPPRSSQTWGAEVFASPSDQTNSGRAVLAATPDSPGSLGIAISEAVEDAATHSDANYALGSVLNHVILYQTVIGQEAKLQVELAGEEPEVVIGRFGGTVRDHSESSAAI